MSETIPKGAEGDEYWWVDVDEPEALVNWYEACGIRPDPMEDLHVFETDPLPRDVSDNLLEEAA